MWTEPPDCTLRVGLSAVSYSFYNRHQRGGTIYCGQLGKKVLLEPIMPIRILVGKKEKVSCEMTSVNVGAFPELRYYRY